MRTSLIFFNAAILLSWLALADENLQSKNVVKARIEVSLLFNSTMEIVLFKTYFLLTELWWMTFE